MAEAKQYWGKFKTEVMTVVKDPVKIGVLAGSALASVAVSAKMDDFLAKGINFKYPWLGWKKGKVPVTNWEVAYPTQINKTFTIIPAMKGTPEMEFKRNIIAGATGSAVSAIWVLPTYQYIDKDLGKLAAVGSGINMLFWTIRGAVKYVGAKIAVKRKAAIPKTGSPKKGKVAPLKPGAKAMPESIKKSPGIKMPKAKLPSMSKIKAPALPKFPAIKMPAMPKIKLWGEFRSPVDMDDIMLDGQKSIVSLNPPRTPLPDDVSNFQQEEYAQANDEPAMAQDYYGDEDIKQQVIVEDYEKPLTFPEVNLPEPDTPDTPEEKYPPVPWGG
jgi:hypothetical protein